MSTELSHYSVQWKSKAARTYLHDVAKLSLDDCRQWIADMKQAEALNGITDGFDYRIVRYDVTEVE